MLAEFHSFITDNCLAKNGSRILMAVSGGIDSMVMAHLLRHLPYETAIAHCNFKLRGHESDDDEDLVRNYCQSYNIPFHTISFDTKRIAKEKGISIQMAARDLRYEWFESIRETGNFESIAIAHNLNDKIETMIINLIRGTGPAGLTGMKVSAGHIIRPLLFATREKISEYSQLNNIKFREDSSNAEVKYIRNRIRHIVIPAFREINPSIEQTLLEESERFSDINLIMTEYIESIRTRVAKYSGCITSFSITELKTHKQNKTILFELFKVYGIKGSNIYDLMKLIDGRTGSNLITDTHRLIKNREEILVSPLALADQVETMFRNIEEINNFPGFRAECIEINDTCKISGDNNMAFIDLDKIVFPVTLRNWKPGDHFFPLGMDHSKKLSDYFVDRKYSIPEKEKKKVIESDGKIIWIVGDRIDNRFKITDRTRRALIIKVF